MLNYVNPMWSTTQFTIGKENNNFAFRDIKCQFWLTIYLKANQHGLHEDFNYNYFFSIFRTFLEEKLLYAFQFGLQY